MRAAAITTSTTPGLHLVLCCCYCIGGNREKPQSRKRALHEGHRACCFAAAAAAAAAIDAFSTQMLPLPGHHSCDCHIASKRSNCAPEHKDTECMPVVMTPHAHSRRRRCRRCRHRCCHHHCRTAAATAATININIATASIVPAVLLIPHTRCSFLHATAVLQWYCRTVQLAI